MAKKTKSAKLRHIISVIFILLLIAAAIILLYIRHKQDEPKISPKPTATIKQLPTTSTNISEQKLNSSSQFVQGGSTSVSNSSAATTAPSNEWTQSTSGVITLKQPISEATISSNAIISGSASVSQIQYTLIDDEVGVISHGMINVTNGSFSTSISFHSYATTGRLDVYSNGPTGQELNEVEIPVNF